MDRENVAGGWKRVIGEHFGQILEQIAVNSTRFNTKKQLANARAIQAAIVVQIELADELRHAKQVHNRLERDLFSVETRLQTGRVINQV